MSFEGEDGEAKAAILRGEGLKETVGAFWGFLEVEEGTIEGFMGAEIERDAMAMGSLGGRDKSELGLDFREKKEGGNE